MSLNRDISSVCLFFFFFLYAAFMKNNCTLYMNTVDKMVLTFKIFASQVNFFREGKVGDHQLVRDVSKFGTDVCIRL